MLNKIELHGYLGKDPELKTYKNAKGENGSLCNLSIGVSRVGDGTDWFDATIFGKRAEVVEKYFKKGSQIIVTGRMQSNTVEKDGRKTKYWSVLIEDFDFCDSKGSANESAPASAPEETTDEAWKKQEEDIPF